jgi:hypothetical protein
VAARLAVEAAVEYAEGGIGGVRGSLEEGWGAEGSGGGLESIDFVMAGGSVWRKWAAIMAKRLGEAEAQSECTRQIVEWNLRDE